MLMPNTFFLNLFDLIHNFGNVNKYTIQYQVISCHQYIQLQVSFFIKELIGLASEFLDINNNRKKIN